jgi:hypothetical protein
VTSNHPLWFAVLPFEVESEMLIRSTIFLLLTLWLIAACDRVQENPKPGFPTESIPEPMYIDMPANDSVSLKLFDSSIINQQITVTVLPPANGTLSPSGSAGTFVYTPNAGFVGVDSITYVYCVGQNCHEARISIQVFPPCQFSLRPDFYSVPNRTSNIVELDVLNNDQISQCSSATITNAWSAQAESINWSNGKLQVKLSPFTSGKVYISYEVCGSFNRCQIADAVLETSPAAGYCEANFATRNDTLELPNGFYFKIFQPEDLVRNDGFCSGQVNLSSFNISRYPSVNGPGKLVFQNGSWWYLVNNPMSFTGDNFAYRICTQAGKCDSATVYVTKNW